MYERESKCPLASCLWHVLRKFDDQRPWYLNMVVTLRGNAFAVLERALQSCLEVSTPTEMRSAVQPIGSSPVFDQCERSAW